MQSFANHHFALVIQSLQFLCQFNFSAKSTQICLLLCY